MQNRDNQLYCRYCGKLIDEDAPFCTYCGEKQNADTTEAKSTELYVRQNRAQVFSSIFKLKRMNWAKIKKRLKRILILVITLIAGFLMVWLGFWLYGLHLASEWTKEDERREAIALKDITQADEIARIFFKEYAEDTHLYRLGCWAECDVDHIKRGIAILRNAAEKGDADAQFTLGTIYAGAHYEKREVGFYDEWDTMLNEKINPQRAAYWYSLAAKQGDTSAMNNLGQAYLKGNGVKRDLVKATELIKAAAEQGNSYAQLSYGDMFRDGEVCIGVVTDSIEGETFIYTKPNIRLAKEWWTKALKNGNEKARKRLEQLYE